MLKEKMNLKVLVNDKGMQFEYSGSKEELVMTII